MANIIKIKRGPKANLPVLSEGEMMHCTDTENNEVWIGTAEGNKLINGLPTAHDALSPESRFKANQHTIESIIGLKEKVTVHVGEEEPIESADTWLDTTEVKVYSEETNWVTLAGTPTIALNNIIATSAFTFQEPIRLRVSGDLDGETFTQELHSDANGVIKGEALIFVSTENSEITTVLVTLEPLSTTEYKVTQFDNTGNVEVASFASLGLEVYRL